MQKKAREEAKADIRHRADHFAGDVTKRDQLDRSDQRVQHPAADLEWPERDQAMRGVGSRHAIILLGGAFAPHRPGAQDARFNAGSPGFVERCF
jgi:2-keto-4-pentenoate hydratase